MSLRWGKSAVRRPHTARSTPRECGAQFGAHCAQPPPLKSKWRAASPWMTSPRRTKRPRRRESTTPFAASPRPPCSVTTESICSRFRHAASAREAASCDAAGRATLAFPVASRSPGDRRRRAGGPHGELLVVTGLPLHLDAPFHACHVPGSQHKALSRRLPGTLHSVTRSVMERGRVQCSETGHQTRHLPKGAALQCLKKPNHAEQAESWR